MPKFEFALSPDETLDLESAVFQALGAASMCWDYPGRAGIFDSTSATEIGYALLDFIRSQKKIRVLQ